MVAAILFAISGAALMQFALYYWRSVVAGVAAQPVSERVRVAAGVVGASVSSRDFAAMMSLHKLTPGLQGDGGGLGVVQAYYRVVGLISHLASVRLPSLAAWSEREMATCARYVAVLVDRRLEHNLACTAEIRSC
jgi:hypothetical protein